MFFSSGERSTWSVEDELKLLLIPQSVHALHLSHVKILKNGKIFFDDFNIKGSPLWKKIENIKKNTFSF